MKLNFYYGLPFAELKLINGDKKIKISKALKHVEMIILDESSLNNIKIDIGAMDYGFEIDAIVGMDILKRSKALIDFHEMSIACKP